MTFESESQAGSVAIVAWQAMPAVFPQSGRGVGGLETAAWTFAKGLAQRTDWSPAMVFRSRQPLPADRVEGVQMWADIDPWEAMRRDVSSHVDLQRRRLRSFSPKLLWQVPLLAITWPFRRRDPALMEPDPRLERWSPDVWVAMGVGRETAGVIATAASQGRPSVVMLQSGADLDAKYAQPELTYSDYGERSDVCRFALQRADYVVCQTEVQRRRLKSLFGRDGELIRNSLDLERWQPSGDPLPREHVLWIGRYETFAKRIQLAIEIARLCPETPFRMIVNPGDPAVERTIREGKPRNIELVDYVPFDEMPQQYARATAFLSTSDASAEGFPNVLLQSAAAKTPIVALDEFDGFLERSGAGVVCDGSTVRAAEAIGEFHSGDRRLNESQVLGYLQSQHGFDVVTDQLAELLTRAKQEFRRDD